MTLTQAYMLLAIAIAGEIISTGTLKATEGFTKWIPSLICILSKQCLTQFEILFIVSIVIIIYITIFNKCFIPV